MTYELRTVTAAAVAAPSWSAGVVPLWPPHHGHRLVFAQEIIGLVRCGTLMRHVIFARPIAACSRRMIDAAAAAHLITATGFALRLSACFLSASFGAVNVAAIAMAANQHLHPTPPAQE